MSKRRSDVAVATRALFRVFTVPVIVDSALSAAVILTALLTVDLDNAGGVLFWVFSGLALRLAALRYIVGCAITGRTVTGLTILLAIIGSMVLVSFGLGYIDDSLLKSGTLGNLVNLLAWISTLAAPSLGIAYILRLKTLRRRASTTAEIAQPEMQ